MAAEFHGRKQPPTDLQEPYKTLNTPHHKNNMAAELPRRNKLLQNCTCGTHVYNIYCVYIMAAELLGANNVKCTCGNHIRQKSALS